MHIFRGTRLGWYMAKPDRSLRRPCAGAGSVITIVKKPADSKSFRSKHQLTKVKSDTNANTSTNTGCLLTTRRSCLWRSCCATKARQSHVSSFQGQCMVLQLLAVDLMLTLSKMCTAFIMHVCFLITNAHSMGTRLGWYMAKPDRALKRPCASAESS